MWGSVIPPVLARRPFSSGIFNLLIGVWASQCFTHWKVFMVVNFEQVCFPSVPQTGCLMMTVPALWSPLRVIASSVTQNVQGGFSFGEPRGDNLARLQYYILLGKISFRRWPGVVMQPQLNPAIEHVSMVVQGIKKADKLSRKPLCEHASRTNSFQVLETYWSVQQERELQTESGVMTWITPIKPPNWMDLWDPLPCQQPSPCLPDVWTHPRSWPDGSPNMAK